MTSKLGSWFSHNLPIPGGCYNIKDIRSLDNNIHFYNNFNIKINECKLYGPKKCTSATISNSEMNIVSSFR